jgi:adenylate cyclase
LDRAGAVPDSAELSVLYADACGFTSAMAKSEADAIARLKTGQTLLCEAAQEYGGHLVDMVGDSALFTFDSETDAFLAARRFQIASMDLQEFAEETRPFAHRFGLTAGRVHIEGERLYGRVINETARIASLVARNCIGVADQSWPHVQPATDGASYMRRSLFAKADEQAIQFFEVAGPGDALASARKARNQPIISISVASGRGEDLMQDMATEATLWECGLLFAAYDWRHDIHEGALDRSKLSQTDYLIRLRVLPAGGEIRIVVELSSPYLTRGPATFARQSQGGDQSASTALAIAADVVSTISHAEQERAAASRMIGSHQLVSAARALTMDFSADSAQKALAYLEKAQIIDPEYPLLHSTLARAYAINWRFGWTERGQDQLYLARDLAQKARAHAPEDARIEADLGFVKVWNNETDDSVWHYERALNVLPFHPELAADAGMVLSYAGRNDEAAQILERSISNLTSDADYRLWSLGDVYFGKRDYKTALKWLNRMANPSQAQRLVAASKARLGLDTSAHVAAIMRDRPDFSVRKWVAIQPFASDEDRDDYRSALLLAGLPE